MIDKMLFRKFKGMSSQNSDPQLVVVIKSRFTNMFQKQLQVWTFKVWTSQPMAISGIQNAHKI